MFARTKRLTLRPGWPEDAATLAAAIGHEAVVMRLSRVPWPYAATDAADFLARARGNTEPFFLIVAHDAREPRLVGGIGLHADHGVHELGYWLSPAAWGRGYATEAGRAVVDIARHALALRRVRARHHVDNPASARVLAKLGFRPSGRIEAVPSLARGGLVETALVELDLAGDDVRPAAPVSSFARPPAMSIAA